CRGAAAGLEPTASGIPGLQPDPGAEERARALERPRRLGARAAAAGGAGCRAERGVERRTAPTGVFDRRMERLMAQPTDLPGGTALLPTLLALQQRLDSGETTAVELTEAAL